MSYMSWKPKYERRRSGALLGVGVISVLGLDLVANAQGFGDPLPGLTAEQLEEFETGKEDFRQVETTEDGLGPTFNAQGCALCHGSPAVGGSSPRNEVRAGLLNGSTFDPLENQGGSLFQLLAIRGECAEMIPPEANVIAERQTQPLFGMGLVEAIPDATIRAKADPFDADGDGISGTPGRGRFGWKAQIVSLLEFAGDAYLNEMGITNDLFPEENKPNGSVTALATCDALPDPEDLPDPLDPKRRRGIDNFANFMKFLAPPPRGNTTAPGVAQGEQLFTRIGCANCHTPVMMTGPNAVAALNQKPVPLYSDLLLHDVGTGDGIAQGNAAPNELRTPPLWGLRASGPLLHDGRASTMEQAILAHKNEAQAVINRFNALTKAQKDQLLAFLRSL